MGKKVTYLLSICMVVIMMGCQKDAPPPPAPVDRVLMIYLAADNNLSDYVQTNIEGLIKGAAAAPASSRIVAYIDTPNTTPRIVEITAAGEKELHRWSAQHNSVSPAVVQQVIAKMRSLAPAANYGLVMWSHGMAWMPSSATAYFSRSRAADGGFWPQTKYFGQDTGTKPFGYLETADLAAAIPDGVFDYILFDACFMASVEVLYALRERADYIIASPTEVISTGFPYELILPELLKPSPDLKTVCRNYYNFYAQHTQNSYRSASISLVRTSELCRLATATAELYATALESDPMAFSAFDISTVQPLDRYRRHFIFDAGSTVAQLERVGAVGPVQVDHWREQLARTIVYEAHTDRFFDLTLDECCGLSTYIPIAAYTDINVEYSTLEWSRKIH